MAIITQKVAKIQRNTKCSTMTIFILPIFLHRSALVVAAVAAKVVASVNVWEILPKELLSVVLPDLQVVR
ncbi:hypothetical protein AN476_18815 [Phaeobacter sp. 11ANDIMAR09]|nr:hypothetical protein AN476_18815 [Phaeobacter sp. 11ANDIMAR09]